MLNFSMILEDQSLKETLKPITSSDSKYQL